MPLLDFRTDRDELCERFGGGLPAGSLVAIEGPAGAGKSILVQRLAYGLAKNGHSIAYVSTELTTAGFLGQMDALRYELGEEVVREAFVFIPVHPVLAARAPRGDALRRLVQARRMYEKDVVVFDAFSKFLQDHERVYGTSAGSLEPVEAALHLFKRLTAAGKTVVLTLEPGQARGEVAALFKEAADVLVSLQFEVQGSTAVRRIVVNRMSRAEKRFGEVIGFRVEPGVGLVLEIRSVV